MLLGRLPHLPYPGVKQHRADRAVRDQPGRSWSELNMDNTGVDHQKNCLHFNLGFLIRGLEDMLSHFILVLKFRV